MSKTNYSFTGRQLAASKPMIVAADQAESFVDSLPSIGIHGMDTALVGPAGPSGSAQIEFLRHWLPGTVRQLTTIRLIDRIAGIQESGNWFDLEVVQKTVSYVAKAELWGDSSNIPLANYKHGQEIRSVVNFEQGYETTRLAEARENAAGINMQQEKRGSAILSLEMARQDVGMRGFGGGSFRVFGLLNDPGLLPYETVTSWTGKTFDEKVADIQAWTSQLFVQSGGHVDNNTEMLLVMPNGFQSAMTTPNTLGMSVLAWMKENYPNIRVEYAPEFVGANGGANVAYLIAERVEDGSDDGGQALVQIVPAKLVNVGSEQRVKSFIEDFANATAGVIVKRPYLIVRASGL